VEMSLLILLGTFVVVGMIHFNSMKMMKIPETKKTVYRNFFWYFYGIVLMYNGALNLIEKGAFYWSFTILFLVGIIIIILNLLGKIETKGN
jgi:hypothetical protein